MNEGEEGKRKRTERNDIKKARRQMRVGNKCYRDGEAERERDREREKDRERFKSLVYRSGT